MNSQIYKIVVLGQGRVGKTSVSLKFVNNEFTQEQQSTVNASYLEKKVKLSSQQSVKLAIWDTAGQEKYNAIAPVYYREAAGAIVVYEITSKQSFQKVKKWVSELEDHAPKNLVLTIAGNKADLETKRTVNAKEVEKFAESHNANHFLVSAKNGLNIKQLFEQIAERICNAKNANKMGAKSMRNNPRLTIENSQTGKPEKQKKECCK